MLQQHIRVKPAELVHELSDVASEALRCVTVEEVTFLEAHGHVSHHRQFTPQPPKLTPADRAPNSPSSQPSGR